MPTIIRITPDIINIFPHFHAEQMKPPLQTKGKLFLIPNLISDSGGEISDEVCMAVSTTKYYLAETPKSARRFLRKVDKTIDLESIDIMVYNKSTSFQELEELMIPLKQGQDIGLITDSGMPGIADPGNIAVSLAHQWGIQVKPFTGPSSIFLALASSGFNGQQFCFHGYLPVSSNECIAKIKYLENDSRKNNCSQMFIETPYRNEKLLKLLQKTLKSETRLCLGYDITGTNESIISKSIREWLREPFVPGKLPCVFIIYSGT